MEKIEKRGGCKQQESTTDLFLRWGNKKRLRCVRVRDPDDTADPSFAVSGRRRIRRKINSHFVAFSSDNEHREPSLPPQSTRLTRNSEAATTLRSESNRKSSPDKEDKLYPTRGYTAAGVVEKPKISSVDGGGGVEESSSKSKHVWPKLYIALTSKEKEEDFMAMKGCKLPHRPKKRAKMIQRTLLLVSPGAWLTDMCQERYEVREKKSTKKRPTGLKAMGSMDSESE
ncbi:uncharacterized protein LOC112521517 [Cynara cardunculus var. scolymus]|uniref:DUF1639 domain-containing protein n=1 Tax=Cynara cardunculus var. scolymus TaxID=59895 RepID=A0A103XH38_CYNCS|nr:uncharacterized protein LOC112521517 [Cynara cardunculus var. scolymus]KVH90645.1 Protein of unknown function DUF1639 [Cynara cardunculus var. scolymus]